MTDKAPSIRLRLEKPNVKMTIKFFINNGRHLRGKDGDFVPEWAEVSIWPDRAHVKVGAPVRHRYRGWPDTGQFNITGTKYPECPEWLRALIDEAVEAIDG